MKKSQSANVNAIQSVKKILMIQKILKKILVIVADQKDLMMIHQKILMIQSRILHMLLHLIMLLRQSLIFFMTDQ